MEREQEKERKRRRNRRREKEKQKERERKKKEDTHLGHHRIFLIISEYYLPFLLHETNLIGSTDRVGNLSDEPRYISYL